jgi:Organic solute transporter Ostalpha
LSPIERLILTRSVSLSCVFQIVFLTFWQGVCIAIFVQLHHQKQQTATTSSSIDDQAMEIQNVLLCLEMLFFSLAHFCVFPAEEWDPQYHERRLQELEEHDVDDDVIDDDDDKNTHILASNRSRLPARRRRPRRQLHRGGSPSIGLGDFASDVGYILSSRRRKRRQQQQQLSQHDDDDVDANDYDNDNTVSTLKTKSSEEYTENDEEENNDTVRIEEEEDVLDFSIDDNEVTHAAGTTSVTAASHQDNSHMEII